MNFSQFSHKILNHSEYIQCDLILEQVQTSVVSLFPLHFKNNERHSTSK